MSALRIDAASEAGRSVVWIGDGVLEDAPRHLESPSGRFVVVSSGGSRAAAARVKSALAGAVLAEVEIDDREQAKNLATVAGIADAALYAGIRRDDALVAIGGGVVSDAAGFAAAILLRGIAWNVVPTTTGAMADAAIGGKTGVDHATGKNLLGAFHAPRVILVDPTAAATLLDRDHRAGLVEAFKAAWIADAALATRAESRVEEILRRDRAPLRELLEGAIRVKARVVAADPREADLRRVLNFGHTLGHAFEAAGDYALRHGEAVAWGIAAALEISRERAGLSASDSARVQAALARLGPFPEPVRDAERLTPFLVRDKKSTAAGIAGVLLRRIGEAHVEESVPLEIWLEAAKKATIG